ncbi:MAG: glutamine amidotransferase [Clostridia bacterium]
MISINICHLYPDLLNLYGDRGNIISMVQRLRWRNVDVRLDHVNLNDQYDWHQYDIVFIGGGQDFEQGIILKDLKHGKAEEIRRAVEEDVVFLCICGGYQLMGRQYRTWDGKEYEFIGALDIHTIGHRKRMIGDFMFRCVEQDCHDLIVTGFENHSGKTYLGDSVSPLGTVISGFGNNGEDKTEGARYRNVFCSYSHGSLLPKNPRLCDLILQKALDRKYPGFLLQELDDSLENQACDFIMKRLS